MSSKINKHIIIKTKETLRIIDSSFVGDSFDPDGGCVFVNNYLQTSIFTAGDIDCSDDDLKKKIIDSIVFTQSCIRSALSQEQFDELLDRLSGVDDDSKAKHNPVIL